MDRPGLGRLDRRGGETIPPRRPHRPRLLTGAAALACAVALAGYTVVLAPARRPLVAAVGGAAVLILLAALAGRSKPPVPWAVAALGAAYALALVERGGGVDPAAPVYAALLFAAAELADWSVDLPRSAVWDRGVAMKRLGALAVSTAAGAAGAAVVAISADVASAGAGVMPTVLGTVCTVIFAGVVALLVRGRAGSAA
jgi:hypothetical protein